MLVFDQYPVNEESGSINIYFYQGEEVATVAMTNRHSGFDPEEAPEDDNGVEAVDALWNTDDLYEVAVSCAQALGTMGKTKLLAALMRAVADEIETALK